MEHNEPAFCSTQSTVSSVAGESRHSRSALEEVLSDTDLAGRSHIQGGAHAVQPPDRGGLHVVAADPAADRRGRVGGRDGIWSGMIGGTMKQTFILVWMTLRTDWNKEVEQTRKRLEEWEEQIKEPLPVD